MGKKYTEWNLKETFGYVEEDFNPFIPGTKEVSFEEAAKFAMKHMRFVDRLSRVKVGMATIESFNILMGLLGDIDQDGEKVPFTFKEPFRFVFKKE